ncbi:MAG: tRNA lysidine(34) synthetase TilS [Rhodobacteraceae bacterium]|nr:tRNA lysidine(34) synthetase TilS [Paracoccaceae bacterium]
MTALPQRFDQAMAALLPEPPRALGVAVSGGGDSVALLHLCSLWVARHDCALHVATVDHGLRPEAAQECALVAKHAERVGAPHQVLRWSWDGTGNLQDRARQARQDLLGAWARAHGISHIALGHTRDDQAETLLMRLKRGSGVDGMAAMSPSRMQDGLTWLRPMLDLRRDTLRDHLRSIGWAWAEDASNHDTRFERVRMRQAMTALGLNADRLAETAAHMAAARHVLDHAAHQAATAILRQENGDMVLERQALNALPQDTRERLVAAALCWVGQTHYRPRLSALRTALANPRATLHGCLLVQNDTELRICREWKAVADLHAPAPGPWDGRWLIDGPAKPGLTTRPLGADGLLQTNRESWLLPRDSLLASPAIWRGSVLIAAPLAGLTPEYRAKCRALPLDWPGSGLSH